MKKRIKIDIVEVQEGVATPTCTICGNVPQEDDEYARVKIIGPSGGQVGTEFVCDLCIIALEAIYSRNLDDVKEHVVE